MDADSFSLLKGVLYLSLAAGLIVAAWRSGVWSWPIALRVFAGAFVLLVLIVGLTLAWGDLADPGQNWLLALTVVAVVAVGVTLLVVWVVRYRK